MSHIYPRPFIVKNIFDSIQTGADGYLFKIESAIALHQGLI
jgi:hypothetical protein